jgi:hypothetical protein
MKNNTANIRGSSASILKKPTKKETRERAKIYKLRSLPITFIIR